MLSLFKTEESRSRPDLDSYRKTKSHVQEHAHIIKKKKKETFWMKNKATLS